MDVSTGVVLAAGEGTRLRPLTHNRPKTMLPAADRPILEHVLDVLVEAGIERLCLVVGYQRERVQEHFGHAYRDVPITYAHQEKQLGSGHALQQAADEVDEPILVVNGDRTIDEGIVTDTLDTFDGRPAVAVLEHPTPSEYGAVEVDGDRLVELVEKPESDEYRLINAGVYAFDTDVFDAIERTPRREGELHLPDVIGTLMDDGEVLAARTDGLWVDATYPWDLLYLTRKLLAEGRVGLPEQEEKPDVWVAESAHVHEDATLQGPVVVGPDAEIAAGAVLGPYVAVGRNATIGSNATVEDTLLDSDTRVGPGTTLIDCVAGQSVTIGAGTVVSGGTADVRVGTSVFEEQRLGAVLADRVDVGGGVTFAPGTLVGADATVGGGATISGWIENGVEVVR
ncbi:NTP transferase domain-containing protein [Natronomonas halophila]|uniref:sugar phosphate nucleotidyltransferase n=1 Tax=Natronomonas halophila TaxID=2747817 RepID=UPI0015B58147|nr:sugar phosphate nucleotidyltransferase [Natronomonas halophila]QLD86851.1 NTP transferase domain-containing protein [Natronomonas halophila]